MEINPDKREFTEIFPIDPEKSEEIFNKLVEKGSIVAKGPEDQLKKLQDDLRKRGYCQIFNTQPLRP